MRLLLDTNILIDYLKGLEPARLLIEKDETKAISLVTWMEVMVGAQSSDEAQTLESWIAQFPTLPVDTTVAEAAVELRKKHSVRLPDAIIWASAVVHRLILVTRNTRDFPATDPGIYVPYEI